MTWRTGDDRDSQTRRARTLGVKVAGALGVAIMINAGPGSAHTHHGRPPRSNSSPRCREPSRSRQCRARPPPRAQRAIPRLGQAGPRPLPPRRRARTPRHSRGPAGRDAPAGLPDHQRRRSSRIPHHLPRLVPRAGSAHSHDRAQHIGDLHQPAVLPGSDQRRGALDRSLQRAAGPRHHQQHRHDLRHRRHPAVLDVTRSPNCNRAVICMVLPSAAELR